MAGVVDRGSLVLEPVHRFPNRACPSDGRLRWPFTELYGQVLVGLGRLAARYPQVESIGIDTWGVDYGLLDRAGRLLAEPISHRDDRTEGAVADVHAKVPRRELFAIDGLQFLPFNTLYQLEAEKHGALWERAVKLVLLPDLIGLWLTGELRAERTNASTTGLLDVRTGEWSEDLMERLGIPPALLAPLASPGSVLGPLLPEVSQRLGMRDGVVVTAVGSHDTASAVAAVPSTTDRFAYVVSGTWSLVGLELAQPVLTTEACDENFTNERGVDDRIRFLRNTGGHWLIQESMRQWTEEGDEYELEPLFAAAASLPPGGPRIDVDDPSLLSPGRMPRRIAEAALRAGQPVPETPPAIVRCIIDSLAHAYASTAQRCGELAGATFDAVHLVGGGSSSRLLCQSTADAAGLPVVAGPAEATAVGNVLVQCRAHGAAPASLAAARAMVKDSFSSRRFEPR